MYLTKAKIENVRILSSFDLDLTKDEAPGWHVLLGDNGSGKSTFIRAVSVALVGRENAAALRQNWSSWLGECDSPGNIALAVQADPKWDRWVGKGKQSNKTIKLRVNFAPLEARKSVSPKFSSENATRTVWGGGKGWFSAAFGPFRRFQGGERDYEKLYYSHPRLAAHLSAFGEDVALSEALEWIRNVHIRALEHDEGAVALKQGIVRFINASDLLPHDARIAEVTSAGVMMNDGASAKVPVEEMSDGYRSILAMTFELLRAMASAFGTESLLQALNAEDGTVNLPGVILIDEIDAHLHPTWQKRIGAWFVNRFPRVQFFVTTHSPIVCQAAEQGSIWRLASPGSEEKSGRVKGQDLDRLLYGNVLEAYSTEYFGAEVTRSHTSRKMLRELATLNLKSLEVELTEDEKKRRSKLQRFLPSTASNFSE